MTYVLGIDTSTMAACAALVDFNEAGEYRVIGEKSLEPGVTHTKTLPPLIKCLLEDNNLTAADVDLYAAGLGPGSYTGLRIGLAAAKGLAWATGKPMVGSPSLDAMVMNMEVDNFPVYPIIDASKGQLYTARYEPEFRTRAGDVQVALPGEIIKEITQPAWFIGEGLGKWGDLLKEELGEKFMRGPESADYPQGRNIARLAYEAWKSGAPADPAAVIPLYVRPPDIY